MFALGLKATPNLADIADALAIGICNVHAVKLNSMWVKKL